MQKSILYSRQVAAVIHHCYETDLSLIVYNSRSICIPITTQEFVICRELEEFGLCKNLINEDYRNNTMEYLLDYLESKRIDNIIRSYNSKSKVYV